MADVTRIQEIFYQLRVEEVMTRNVITVTPQTSMREFEAILRERRISGVPVVEGERLAGVISLADLIEALETGEMERTVGELMTRDPEVLHPSEMVIQAIRKLEKTNFGRFPVVRRSTGNLVGILTRGDVIRGTLKQLDIDYRQREVDLPRARYFFEDVTSEDTSITLRYTVQPQDFVHGGQASSQIKRSLQRLGLGPQILRRVAVAAYEAEMNLIVHTTHGGRIEARIRPNLLRIDVIDDGPGIENIEQALQPGFSTAPEWIRELGFGAGMGLTNIQNCADEMHLQSSMAAGTHLHVLFKLD
ncbi:MAG: CBS domain-containing protein [Anaerolineae bacterium]|nr:CBS domain-containing protein [Anaerolineae bacterium]